MLPALVLFLLLMLIGGVLWFNRDPQRHPPDAPDAVLSPADGFVVAVDQAVPPYWLEGQAWRIAIFLGLQDVHVQRAPMAGQVAFSQLQEGGYRPALDPASAHNAGHWLGIEQGNRHVLLLRSAGIIARRVLTSVQMSDSLSAGQRIGRILLGSRAELYLPMRVEILVKPGSYVRAGETILARWVDTP